VTIGPGRWSARSPLERLAATGHGGHTAAVIRRVAGGELIVAQGDEDTHMFIVQSGCVEVRRHVGDQVVVHGRVERGDFFGEMSLLESQPRAADVVAVEESVLLELGAGALLLRIRRDPTLAVEMLQKLSGRIRDLNAALAELTSGSTGVGLLEDV